MNDVGTPLKFGHDWVDNDGVLMESYEDGTCEDGEILWAYDYLEFEGTYNREGLKAYDDFFHQKLAVINWADQQDELLAVSNLQRLILFAMQLAILRGLNAAQVVSGAIENFATRYLDKEEGVPTYVEIGEVLFEE
jgi:hypothetical protein